VIVAHGAAAKRAAARTAGRIGGITNDLADSDYSIQP